MNTDKMEYEPFENTPEPEQQPPKRRHPSRRGGFAVPATQTAVCLLLLGVALGARMIPFVPSEEWQTQLIEELADNRMVEWIFGDWTPSGEISEESGESVAEVSSTVQEEESSAESSPPSPQSVVSASPVSLLMGADKAEQTAATPADIPSPLCLPLTAGTLTSDYGEREHPISGEDSFHTGWDIAAEKGTPIASMYDAAVSKIGSGGSYGNYVELQVTDTLSVLYAHCSQVLVKEGQSVSPGETVAAVGSTGVSTGNHLHLEVLLSGTPCNPSVLFPKSVYSA